MFLPDMLAEVGRNWVHDGKDGFDVGSNNKWILFSSSGDQITFFDCEQVIEDDDNRSVLHLSVSFVSISERLVNLVHHDFVPKSVLCRVILSKVKRLLGQVILDPSF